MRYQVVASRDTAGAWLAEAIDHDGEGEVYSAMFYGKKARQRADDYVAWQNADGPIHAQAQQPKPRRATR
jgi:hypothetical protein